MAIDHIEFLNFAKSLPAQGEINCRNAMSRAYYAAFHTCNLMYRASSAEEGGMHAKLILTLQGSPDAKDREIGRMLSILKGQRIMADYHLGSNLKDSDRETSILQAELIIQKIAALFGAPSVVSKQS